VIELAVDLQSKRGLPRRREAYLDKKVEVGLKARKNSANTHFEMLITTITEDTLHLA
jgi:hypothetical protein